MSRVMKQIKALMIKQDITQAYMADMVNVTPVTMCKWLNGSRCPNIEDVEKMAAVLGVRVGLAKERSEDVT